MSIQGAITTRHVLANSRLILRCYGPGAWLRCCLAVLLQKRTTFLACVVRLRSA
jgi:hypothetical protein